MVSVDFFDICIGIIVTLGESLDCLVTRIPFPDLEFGDVGTSGESNGFPSVNRYGSSWERCWITMDGSAPLWTKRYRTISASQ